jgi:hypothetical protein
LSSSAPADRPAKRRCLGGREPLPFNCRQVVAPMVGCSDLAWRLLCRQALVLRTEYRRLGTAWRLYSVHSVLAGAGQYRGSHP